jgi:hypothetical protein
MAQISVNNCGGDGYHLSREQLVRCQSVVENEYVISAEGIRITLDLFFIINL